MIRMTALAAAMLFPLVLHADPFPNTDPGLGKKYFDEAKCNSCHDSMMGGHGDLIFTRPGHKVKDAPALAKMVRFCVSQTGAAVFPEDVENIAAYLNQQFYKFK